MIKLNTVDLQFIKKESIAQVFSCKFWKICKNTFLAEQHWTALQIIALSVLLKEELANETVNYDRKTKA